MSASAEAGLTAVLDVQDNASPKLKGFTAQLVENKSAMRELGMGAMHTGAAFMMMGLALNSLHNPMAKTIADTLTIVGGVMTFIGTTASFVGSIGKIVDALRKMAIMQSITQALSGPGGWAALGVGAVVAVGAVAGISALEKQTKAGSATVTTNVNLDGRQIAQVTRRNIILDQQRNAGSGIHS